MLRTKLFILLLISLDLEAQLTGDYRSSGNVDLNLSTNWEVFDGSSWIVSVTGPDGNVTSGNTITIQPGHQWSNAGGSMIGTGVTLIHQGTSGTFSQGISNKITLAGTYIHNTVSAIAVILNGMNINTGSYFIYRGTSLEVPAGSFSGRTYHHLSFESTSGNWTMNLGSGSNPLAINGTLSIGAGITLNQGSFTGSIDLNDITVAGALSLNSYTIKAGKQLSLSPAGQVFILPGHSLTVNGTLDAGEGKIDAEGVLLLNGRLRTSNSAGLSAAGTFLNHSNITIAPGATIEYNGAAGQPVTNGFAYHHLDISGSGTKQITGDIEVSGDLALSNNLQTTNWIINVSGAINSSGGAYIQTNGSGGLKIRNLSMPRTFPVGASTFNAVSINSNAGFDWQVSVKDEVNQVQLPYTANKAIKRTWMITPSAAASASVTFTYNDGDASQKGVSFSNTEDVQLWQLTNDNWMTASLAISPSGTPGGERSITVNDISSFSSFAIANLSGPLPVHFTNLMVHLKDETVQIAFTNETETNVTDYQVEHSTDGIRFRTIKNLKPKGNDGGSYNYQYQHKDVAGQNWYRISAMESDKTVTTSKVFHISYGRLAPELYFSRLSGQFIQFHVNSLPAGIYNLRLIDTDGAVVYHRRLFHYGDLLTATISRPIRSGRIYYIKIDGYKDRLLKRFILP